MESFAHLGPHSNFERASWPPTAKNCPTNILKTKGGNIDSDWSARTNSKFKQRINLKYVTNITDVVSYN